MNKNSFISVIVPIYNSKRCIEKCIKSILCQTYKNIEILLINDGSTDNSLDICKKYAKKDKRIKIINKKNGGVSSARNVGLLNSTGKYISFVDSDDYIEKNMIELLYNSIIEEESDIAICNLFFEDENGGKKFNNKSENFCFIREKFPEFSFYNKNISGFVCNKLYTKSILNNIFFDKNIIIGEDNLFNYEILNNNQILKYSYINNCLYHYVQNSLSQSNKKFNINKISYLDAKEKEIMILCDNNILNDFLKAEYIIYFIRTKIILKNNNFKNIDILKKYKYNVKKFKKEIKFKNLKFAFLIKYLIAVYMPVFYKFKIHFSNRNN